MTMKWTLTLAALVFTAVQVNAQNIFASSFENWTGTTPDGWVGAKTSLEADSIIQADQSIQYGNYAVKLVNAESSHKRFTTQSLAVDSGLTYTIRFYVRGEGNIRTGLFDGRSSGSGYSGYNPYINVNSQTWTMYSQQVTAIHDTTDGEFILSVQLTKAQNGHLDVDSVRIFVGAANPPMDASIHDIQFTSDPGGASPLAGETVNTGGIVTAVHSSGYWIQNGGGAWNGVFVFDNGNTPMIGDSITLTANVTEFQSLTELTNINAYVMVSSGNALVTADVSTLDATTEDYEGQLVRATNAQCIDPNVGFGQWIINDGSGPVFVDDMMYNFTATQGVYYDVTGPLHYSFSEWKIEPRDVNDVSVASSIAERFGTAVTVYPNPASDLLFVHVEGVSERTTFQINDLSGRIVMEGLLLGDRPTIDMNSLSTGTYMLTLRSPEGIRSGMIQVAH